MNQGFPNVPEVVPVFPLPEVVLFPRQVLPLHIFEPRYRRMVADALAGENSIAIALLRRDYEPDYFTLHAPIHALLGVGRIVVSEKLDDGKYNILLQGVERARIVEELAGRPYRRARVETVLSRRDGSPDARRQLRCELLAAVLRLVGSDDECREQCLRLFDSQLSLGTLADLIAGGLPAIGELRQCLLEELAACARTRILLEQLDTLGSVRRCACHTAQYAEWQRN